MYIQCCKKHYKYPLNDVKLIANTLQYTIQPKKLHAMVSLKGVFIQFK